MAVSTQATRMKDYQSKVSQTWDSLRPYGTAFVIGLIAGPILTALLGFQVLESAAAKRSEAAAMGVQAQICAAQAKIAVPSAADLNWVDRNELAQQWAVMPGSTVAAPGVATTCGNLLAARA